MQALYSKSTASSHSQGLKLQENENTAKSPAVSKNYLI